MLEFKSKEWDYRVLPNKMYELVRNTGSMYKESTGYITDAESEMITVLMYLNDGEKTNITESMIEQIEEAIKNSQMKPLMEDDTPTVKREPRYVSTGKKSDISNEIRLHRFVKNYVELAATSVVLIRKRDVDGELEYNTFSYDVDGSKTKKTFRSLQECRAYAKLTGYSVRLNKTEVDEDDIVECWI